MKKWLAVLLMCLPASGQVTYRGGRSAGTGTYVAQGQGSPGTGENVYCPAGTGELTEGTPTWGTSDGVAQLPTRCMNTAMSSTPSGTHLDNSSANTFTPATNTLLQSVLSSANGGAGVLASGGTGGTLHFQCGDTIILNAGSIYTGPFTFPALSCNGAHWTIVRTSGTADPNFPAEGVRATPCISGIANDASHGRGLPGYPDYSCASYPAVLSAQLVTGTTNSPAVTFTSLADHYRFIGIEVTKVPNVRIGGLILNFADGQTMGTNHIIWDRSIIHGEPWTTANGVATEVQAGVRANNSRWMAVINSWIYDTYCLAACVDSQAYAAGSGLYQDGPHKLFNNLLATSGETYLFGGGGQGALGTPVPKDFEFRANYAFKPLVWMVPIDTCSLYNAVTSKNLGEFKNMSYALIEGNYFSNSWQGCQSDQLGVALATNPSNQNNHQSMSVTFDGTTNVVTAVGSDSFSHNNGTPGDTAYCIEGGCVLAINDSSRGDDNVEYRFCNGTNGCDQSGMNQTTQARIVPTSPLPVAGTAVVNACVPGDCPTCRVQHITIRYNEVYNTTGGIHVNSGRSSICHDEAAGNDHVMIHDNLIHGLSVEMSNGSDPYSQALPHLIASNTANPISTIEISHETAAVASEGNLAGGLGSATGSGAGGLGQQVDRTNLKYLSGLSVHDNVAQASWTVANSSGSPIGSGGGVGGNNGLANTYEVDACRAYYPTEAPDGIVVPAQHSIFTLSPSLANYFVTLNGKYRALNSGFTGTGFTLTAAASDGDTITIRDLNDCQWTFRGNLLGAGVIGGGKDMSPYPSSNDTNCGGSGTAGCILDGANFTNLFANWGNGRTGDFHLTGSNAAAYQNSASDAATRAATGKNPGADLTVLGQLTSGIGGSVFYPSLSITTTSLSGNINVPMQAALHASAGASPYRGWWLETTPELCGGNCGTLAPGIVIGRGGTVNGPFAVLTVALASNTAKITLKQTMIAGANSWTPGQNVELSSFCIDSGNLCTGNGINDAVFNGTWQVVASGTNCTNSVNVVCLSLTAADIPSHAPSKKGLNDPAATFAPTTIGTFTWWMGVRDGAFQSAWGAVTLVVGSQGGQNHQVDLNWNASLSSGQNGCCTYNLYRSVDPGAYGPANATQVSGTTFTDTTVLSGTTYYYVVTAFDGIAESAYSNEAVAVVP